MQIGPPPLWGVFYARCRIRTDSHYYYYTVHYYYVTTNGTQPALIVCPSKSACLFVYKEWMAEIFFKKNYLLICLRAITFFKLLFRRKRWLGLIRRKVQISPPLAAHAKGRLSTLFCARDVPMTGGHQKGESPPPLPHASNAPFKIPISPITPFLPPSVRPPGGINF